MLTCGCRHNPAADKQRFLKKGDGYFAEKRYGEAVIEYKNALRADPAFGDGYYHLALALLQEGQWSSATESLSRAVQFSPDNVDARLRLGDILIAAGQYDDARTQIDEVMKRDPQNASVHLMFGQIALQRRKYDEAELEYEQARKLAPDSPVPYGDLALAELLNNKFDLAERNFQKAAEIDPKDPQYATNWANFYRTRQRTDRAEQVLKEGMARNGGAVELPFALADLYVYLGRPAEARQLLDQVESHPERYEDAQRKVADFYFQHNDASSALSRYLALDRKHPSDPIIVQGIVQCDLQLARWPDAEEWINKQDKKDADPNFELLRARAYMGTYRLNDAISELEGLIQKEPGNTFAHYYLAQANLQKGDVQAAKSSLNQALQVQPGYMPALITLGGISLQQGDSEVALAYASQVITQSYWSVDAHLIAGNAFILRGDAAAALKEFQLAAALNPISAAAQERLARVVMAEGKRADAEQLYEKALTADPGYVMALGGLTELYIAEGQLDRAHARIDQQIERAPALSQLQLFKGQFCLNHGDLNCTMQSFQRAIELNSYDPTAYMSLAAVYGSTNRNDSMVREYQVVQQKFPQFLPVYVQLGRAYEQGGDFAEASQAYESALRIDPNYVPALNNLAWLYCQRNESLNEALELAQRAKKQEPNDPHVNDTLGWVYFKKGLDPLAVRLLESAVAENPKEPAYQFHLGMVYMNLGKQEQGRKTLQGALRTGLDPDATRLAKEALQKIGS